MSAHRFGASVLALLLGGAVLVGSPTAAATEPAAVAAPPAGATGAVAQLRLASRTAWATPGGEAVLRLSVSAVGPAPARPLELAVSVHERLTSRSAFLRTVEGDALGRTVEAAAATLDELPRDAAGAYLVRLALQPPDQPRDPALVPVTRPGVHPVRVELREAGGGPSVDRLTTHLVVVPPDVEAPRLRVAWLLPFDASPVLRPDGSAELPAPDQQRLRSLVDALDEHPELPVTAVPTPETLEGLATAEDMATSQLRSDLVDALAARPWLAAPYVPVDPAALAEAELAPALREQFVTGRAVVDEALERPPAGATLVDGDLVPDTIAALGTAGARRLFVPESALQPVDLVLTLARPVRVAAARGDAGVPAVVLDDQLAEHLDGPLASEDPVLAAHHLLADLAVLWFDSPGVERGVAFASPRRWRPSPALLRALTDGLASSSVVDLVPGGELFALPTAEDGGQPLVRVPARSRRGDGLALDPRRFRSVRRQVAAVKSMRTATPPGDVIERLLLLALHRSLGPATAAAYLRGVEQQVADRLSEVVAPEAETITLTSREAAIPLTFHNSSGQALEVSVALVSDKLEFPEGAVRTLALPDANTTVQVPVRAKSSGAFPLRVIVRTPDGRLELARTTVTVRSTAVSGVGVALSVGAALFLGAWWVRHLRRARRRAHGDPTGGIELEGDRVGVG